MSVRKMLEVTGRPLRYATRRLLPGDEFMASNRDARVLVAMGRAREPRPLAELPPPPPALIAKVTPPALGGDVAALRAEYERVLGKRPFTGWSAELLREKIRAAQS